MILKKNGGPAFPVPGDANMNDQEGMFLRDYFAGQALAGMLADSERSGGFSTYAKDAYSFADAMLRERAGLG
jgi:hypothetical protein